MVQISRFGVIPKSQPGKWRLIVDLSHPADPSVNDDIETKLCTMNYTSVDEAVQRLVSMGSGAQLAKLDVGNCIQNRPGPPNEKVVAGDATEGNLYIVKNVRALMRL